MMGLLQMNKGRILEELRTSYVAKCTKFHRIFTKLCTFFQKSVSPILQIFTNKQFRIF